MRWILSWLMVCIPLFATADVEPVVVGRSTVHEGDYFSAGGDIEIFGVITGDVYAFGSQILIDGVIEGDVIAIGGQISISGNVVGSARLAGGQIEIDGGIGKNLTAAGTHLELGSRCAIEGNAVLCGGDIDVSGAIDGNLTLTAPSARLVGAVGGGVKAFVGRLRIGAGAHIAGALDYKSGQLAQIDPGAEIAGEIAYRRSAASQILRGEWRRTVVLGSRLTVVLMNLIYSFVAGWIFIRFFPDRLDATLAVLNKFPWRSFWIGLLVFFLLPLFCVLLMVTILGFSLALALLAVSLLSFYTTKIFPILWMCDKVAPSRKNRLWIFLLGLLIFFVASQLPYIGEIVRTVFTLTGLGALCTGKISRKKPH